ncbi:hypothetical protein PTSG_10693 [Salpingoeca rosetta]|uniref:Uncharacterized protein n=1 Tax=Salpingoeca rosetta (strain ATCC 50818 / BSB-021) TaxID=946362 RepID=F2UQ40_SALR5|nr:uncharacterized protein PTSG_10693 [Salpingoeca rosetta]EGD79708.1 hypothetical protein PTSG_10693 [Salpingoeca rosetta]|eukprot:XP_004988658.1 hypothetical protein PTSG_10693 [Salpingoeca rosetta]
MQAAPNGMWLATDDDDGRGGFEGHDHNPLGADSDSMLHSDPANCTVMCPTLMQSPQQWPLWVVRFADRLRKELREIAPPAVEINIVDDPNRHLAVWTGGSVVASSKGFNFHWISRDEYREYGVDLLHSTR